MYAKKVKEFSYRGYTCFIRELGYNPGEISTQIAFALQDKWFCGYVAVDVDDDTAMKIDCHGGITWNRNNLIGFDCNHLDDNPIVLNDRFCEMECKRIVDQLIEMNIPPYTGNDSYTFKDKMEET